MIIKKKLILATTMLALTLAGCADNSADNSADVQDYLDAEAEKISMQPVKEQEEVEETSIQPAKEQEETKKVADTHYFRHQAKEDAEDKRSSIENLKEDTSDIAGVYRAVVEEGYQSAIHRDGYNHIADHQIIVDIKDDGTFTSFNYVLMDTDSEELTGRQKWRTRYVDANDVLHDALEEEEGEIVDFDFNGYITSGYVIEEFGEIRFVQEDVTSVEMLFDENGEVMFNTYVDYAESNEHAIQFAAINFHLDPMQSKSHITDEGVSFNDTDFEAVDISGAEYDLIREEDGGLRSAHQTLINLKPVKEDRYAKRDVFGESTGGLIEPTEKVAPYYYNTNDAAQAITLIHDTRVSEITTDTAQYTGYNKDNEEITPDVVIVTEKEHILGMFNNYIMYFEDGKWGMEKGFSNQ